MISRAPGAPPKTAPSAPSTASWGNYVPTAPKAAANPPGHSRHAPPDPSIPKPPPGQPTYSAPTSKATAGHPWGVGEPVPDWIPAPPREPPPPDWQHPPPGESPPPERRPMPPREPPPQDLVNNVKAAWTAPPSTSQNESMDTEWIQELISHPAILNHSSRLHSGNPLTYGKRFFRLAFGLALLCRPQGLTLRDLEPSGYPGLYGTLRWEH